MNTSLAGLYRYDNHQSCIGDVLIETFHVLVGKTKVTLQDVAVLLMLYINGRPVISPVLNDVRVTIGIIMFDT